METTIKHHRARVSFRFQPVLVDRLRTEAKRCNLSVNSYVEERLSALLFDTPNATTLSAMQETLSGKYAGEIDTTTRESFINSILGREEG
ncbi:MAG: toxin-antitoxin system protein [Bacteroidaceae bacterium]|nr:toxin-antitoxin system protein [Bacteroidaceae bacterium]